MKELKENRGFSFIEILVVVAIVAILAAIAVPAYNRIEGRAERSAALNNAQAIVSCINAHNKTALSEDNVEPILGRFEGNFVVLSGVDEVGNQVDDIDTIDKFNNICENEISLMSKDDYDIAMQYVTILYPDDEFAVKEDYDHTS